MIPCPHCGEIHDPGMHFCARTGEPIELGSRLVGQVILGHYRAISILGQGPVGVVLEVEDESSGIRMAAKILHPVYAREEEGVKRFLDEAIKAGALSHPNLATVYEAALDAGNAPTIIRELLVGECLSDLMKRLGQMPMDLCVHIMRQILSGLSAAHNAGIVNLDLSPADVFISIGPGGSQVVKLVDFGEAHLKHGKIAASTKDPMCTSYFAPEQKKSGWECDMRADIYASGVILYEMLAGETPSKLPRPVNQLRKDVEKQLALAVAKSMEMSQDRRYQTADEFRQALDALGLPRPEPVELQTKKDAEEPAQPAPSSAAAAVQTDTDVTPEEPSAAPANTQSEDQSAATAPAGNTVDDSWSSVEKTARESESPPSHSPDKSAAVKQTPAPDKAQTHEPEEQTETTEPPDQEEEVDETEEEQAEQSQAVVPPSAFVSTPPSQPEETVPVAADEEEAEKAPSVIVDMPEAEAYASMIPKRPVWHYVAVSVAALAVIILLVWAFSSDDKPEPPGKEEAAAQSAEEFVKIKISVSPEQAHVWLDGELLKNRPIVLDVPRTDRPRTVRASAENYEDLEKIIVFDKSQTVKVELSEIIQPAEEEIEEVAPDSPQPAAEKAPDQAVKDVPPAPEIEESPEPEKKPAQEKPVAQKKKATQKKKTAKKKKAAKKKKSAPKTGKGGFSSENPY